MRLLLKLSLETKIDVPEIPLSYRLTGDKNTVTPKELINPAIVKSIIFFNFKILIFALSSFGKNTLSS